MAKRQKQRIVTKKHMARVDRERLQSRNITIAMIALLFIVIFLIGYGIIEQNILIPRTVLATVGDETITARKFQARSRFERRQLVNDYINTYQLMQDYAGEEGTQSIFETNLQQIAFQLEPEFFGQQIILQMVDEALARQEAEARGLTISQEELDEAVRAEFGFFPQGTPTPTPTRSPVLDSTLSPTQLALVSPTATAVETDVIEATPSDATTEENGTPVPTIELSPTATPYTRASYNELYQRTLENFEAIDFSEQDLIDYIRDQLYLEILISEITKDLLMEQEQVWARHILVEDENTAIDVLARLDEGEDFVTLAAELSTDTGNKDRGGDLGWFGRGRMVIEFEEAAFPLEIGEISQPVETSFGWHIIQVLGHEMRALDDYESERISQQTFQDWLADQRELVGADITEDLNKYVVAEPSIPPKILISTQQQP